MNKDTIKQMVIEVINTYLEGQTDSATMEKVTEKTILTGDDSIKLESIGLVLIVVEIEEKLGSEGIEVSLISEDSMASENSPFRSVETLSDYIFTRINHN